MQFHQRFVPGLAIASYIIGDEKSGEAAVIDPTRDVDDFIAFAKENDLHIKHIIETHVHAHQLYESVFKRLDEIPDITEVYPAHGAGSLCGKAIGSRRSSTVGFERRFNSSLKEKPEDQWVKDLLDEMPLSPPYFKRMKRVNKEGPAIIGPELPGQKRWGAKQVHERVCDNCLIVDVRSKESFAAAHIPDAMSVHGLDTKRKSEKQLTVLDVRTDKEWSDGHIERGDAHSRRHAARSSGRNPQGQAGGGRLRLRLSGLDCVFVSSARRIRGCHERDRRHVGMEGGGPSHNEIG